MVTAARTVGSTGHTLRLGEDELRLAVAQFLRYRGLHTTPKAVRFTRTGGEQAGGGETVAEVVVSIAGDDG
jgi:hypothetical protein